MSDHSVSGMAMKVFITRDTYTHLKWRWVFQTHGWAWVNTIYVDWRWILICHEWPQHVPEIKMEPLNTCVVIIYLEGRWGCQPHNRTICPSNTSKYLWWPCVAIRNCHSIQSNTHRCYLLSCTCSWCPGSGSLKNRCGSGRTFSPYKSRSVVGVCGCGTCSIPS